MDTYRNYIKGEWVESSSQRTTEAATPAIEEALRPLDGLADSREEQFEVTLPSAADAARLVIRASDVMQNVTSAVAGGR